MAVRIMMPFGVVSQFGPRMCSMSGGADRFTLRSNFWGGYVAARCNIGSLWHWCARTREMIELPF